MRIVIAIALLALSACGSKGDETPDGNLPDGEVPIEVEFSFTDLDLDGEPSELTALRFIPGGSEFLALARTGQVYHYDLDTEAGETTLLGQFSPPDVHVQLDCGLLSLAFDPDYAINHYLYLGHCVSRQESAVRRVVFDAQSPDYESVADTTVEVIRIGDLDARRPWHNVGAIGFDADGHMFAFFGDKTIEDNGQDPSNDLASLIRIDPKKGIAEPGFDAVSSNPFVGDAEKSDNIYAYGLRSPWQGFVDSRGRYWIGDVGSNEYEEINVITAPGQNFGWADHEGECKGDCEGITDPIAYWDRKDKHPYAKDDPQAILESPRVGWTALEYTEDGDDPYYGTLTGKVLFGDMCVGFVRALEVDENTEVVSDEHIGHLANATGWHVGPDGHIYAVTFTDRCTTGGDESPPSRLVRLDATLVSESQASP